MEWRKFNSLWFFLSFCLWDVGGIVFPLFHNSWNFITDYFFFILKSNQPTLLTPAYHLNVSAEILLLSRLIPPFTVYTCCLPLPRSILHATNRVRFIMSLLYSKPFSWFLIQGLFNFQFLYMVFKALLTLLLSTPAILPLKINSISFSLFLYLGMHWGYISKSVQT